MTRIDLLSTTVSAPTGVTATDTAAIQAAITTLVGAGGKGKLRFPKGTYQVDGNALVIQGISNFALVGDGDTYITLAPARAGAVNAPLGNILTIADCTDFRVQGITLDGLRDTVSRLIPLSAAATSGQPSVTVAAGAAAAGGLLVGSVRCVSTGSTQSGGAAHADTSLTVSSITPGGGTGGGDLVTFTTNLANAYSTISTTMVNDDFGPMSCQGDYLSPFECGTATVAGRTCTSVNQNNALQMMNCTRYIVTGNTFRNVWGHPVMAGTGYIFPSADACSQGVISNNLCAHSLDAGISVWSSTNVTVANNVINSTGWSGVGLTGSDRCTVSGNQIIKPVQLFGGVSLGGGGHGIVSEGGQQNTIKGNSIYQPYANGIKLTNSPQHFSLISPSSCPTTSAFLASGTAAGTSILVSSTANLRANGQYSIVDGSRTEPIVVATIVDGTHITLAGVVQFSHATTMYITPRITADTLVEGNTIVGPQTIHGIDSALGVRTLIKNNIIRDWTVTGFGINLVYVGAGSVVLPTGVTVAGQGSIVEGNNLSGAGGTPIRCDSTDNLVIKGNRVSNANTAGSSGITLNGVIDSTVSGNYVTDIINSSGIQLAAGTQSANNCARVTISDNVVSRTAVYGIRIIAADSCAVLGNIVKSCVSHGIELAGATNCTITGNTANSNGGNGIMLENSGSNYPLYNVVSSNTCRQDASGVNVTSGAALTQAYGIRETGSANFNQITNNVCSNNATGQLVTVGAGTIVLGNTISNVTYGTSSAGTATASTPTFANGTAAQLAQTTADAEVYLTIGTAGTAFTLKVGPTSGVANTVVSSVTPTAGQVFTVRVPAGWFLQWAGTSTTVANQLALTF